MDFPRTTEQLVADIEALAIEVVRDLPRASLEQQMAEAMRRNRGSMLSNLIRNALRHFGGHGSLTTEAAPPNHAASGGGSSSRSRR